MITLKQKPIFKTIAVFLVAFMVFQLQYLHSEQVSLQTRLETAKKSYFGANYEAAKGSLEELVTIIDRLDGRENFKGETYLLLGAVYEKLNYQELAIKYYCKAKDLLGAGNTFEGLDLDTLKFYRSPCGGGAMVAAAESDELVLQYQRGRDAYFGGDFEGAKPILEALVAALADIDGRDTLKGETYLVLGALYEKLKRRDPAINYYCKAKEILGKNRTIEGLNLKRLRYYKRNCPASAVVVAGAKRKRGGGFFGVLLGLALIGAIVYFLVLKKKDGDDPAGPCASGQYGAYTSVTLKIEVTYKGLNSKGTRRLWVAGDQKVGESFKFAKKGNANSTCNDAVSHPKKEFTVTTTTGKVSLRHVYKNWDYNSWVTGTNYKLLCTSWTFTILDYSYDTSKCDPGAPTIKGTDQLTLDIGTDCVQKSQRVHDCETNAELTFERSTTHGKTARGRSVTVTQVRKVFN